MSQADAAGTGTEGSDREVDRPEAAGNGAVRAADTVRTRYSAPISGQIVFRRAVGQVRQQDYSQPRRPDPWTYSMGLGLIHVEGGEVEAEKVHGVILGGSRGGMRMGMHGGPRSLSGYREDEAYVCDIGPVLTAMEVRSPEGFASMLAHGGLFLRRTRFPGPEGTTTFLVGAVMRTTPEQLPERTMFTLRGTLGGFDMVDPRPVPEAFPVGSTPSQTLGMPIWQARDGLRGIRSSLHLDLIDEIAELRALEDVETRTEDQETRLQDLLRGEAGSVSIHRRRDSDYAAFLRLAKELGEDVEGPFDSYPTPADVRRQDETVKRLVSAMYERREREDEQRRMGPR